MERKLLINPEVHQEITRRAAGGKHLSWAIYLLLLSACADVISSAPETVEECELFSAEEQVGDDLTRIAGIINLILPGGIEEFAEYLSEATRRTRNVARQRVMRDTITKT